MGKSKCGNQSNGSAGGCTPASRLGQIAARGDAQAPTPEVMGEMAWAGALDMVTGQVDNKTVNGLCRAMQTFVAVARNDEAVGNLSERIAAAAKERKAAQLAEAALLRARLAELEADDTDGVALPPKG